MGVIDLLELTSVPDDASLEAVVELNLLPGWERPT
jgi:hypothetical protein